MATQRIYLSEGAYIDRQNPNNHYSGTMLKTSLPSIYDDFEFPANVLSMQKYRNKGAYFLCDFP